MKKLVLPSLVLLVVFILFSFASCTGDKGLQPRATPAESRQFTYIVINDEYTAARNTPDMYSEVVALLRYGEFFEVVERQVIPSVVHGTRGYWFKIMIDLEQEQRYGWVFDSSFTGFATYPEAELHSRSLVLE